MSDKSKFGDALIINAINVNQHFVSFALWMLLVLGRMQEEC